MEKAGLDDKRRPPTTAVGIGKGHGVLICRVCVQIDNWFRPLLHLPLVSSFSGRVSDAATLSICSHQIVCYVQFALHGYMYPQPVCSNGDFLSESRNQSVATRFSVILPTWLSQSFFRCLSTLSSPSSTPWRLRAHSLRFPPFPPLPSTITSPSRPSPTAWKNSLLVLPSLFPFSHSAMSAALYGCSPLALCLRLPSPPRPPLSRPLHRSVSRPLWLRSLAHFFFGSRHDITIDLVTHPSNNSLSNNDPRTANQPPMSCSSFVSDGLGFQCSIVFQSFFFFSLFVCSSAAFNFVHYANDTCKYTITTCYITIPISIFFIIFFSCYLISSVKSANFGRVAFVFRSLFLGRLFCQTQGVHNTILTNSSGGLKKKKNLSCY